MTRDWETGSQVHRGSDVKDIRCELYHQLAAIVNPDILDFVKED